MVPQSHEDIEVVIGDHNIADEKEDIHKASNVINHPKYEIRDGTPYAYDHSIVTLAEPLTFSSKVAPICAPASSSDPDPYAGKQATAIGWGKTDYIMLRFLISCSRRVRKFGPKITGLHILEMMVKYSHLMMNYGTIGQGACGSGDGMWMCQDFIVITMRQSARTEVEVDHVTEILEVL